MEHLSKLLFLAAIPLYLVLFSLNLRADEDSLPAPAIEICVSCHGNRGISTLPQYPNIAGQNEKYLENALLAYKKGFRNGGTAGLMIPIVMSLTENEIAIIAKYYADITINDKCP